MCVINLYIVDIVEPIDDELYFNMLDKTHRPPWQRFVTTEGLCSRTLCRFRGQGSWQAPYHMRPGEARQPRFFFHGEMTQLMAISGGCKGCQAILWG